MADFRKKTNLTSKLRQLFLSPKHKAFLNDINQFFQIRDLDELNRSFSILASMYGIKVMQGYYMGEKIPDEKQGKANLFFYPLILDDRIRLSLQKLASTNFFGEYVFLATVVGLQQAKFEDINEYGFFINKMGGFFKQVHNQHLTNDFSLILADRITVTLFSFPSTAAFYGIHKVIVPLLKSPDFKKLHHNLFLLLAKHERAKQRVKSRHWTKYLTI